MTERNRLAPPAHLLASIGAPDAALLEAEVRSNTSLSFSPGDGKDFLQVNQARFGALILWQAEMSWAEAQQVQAWLTGTVQGHGAATREALFRGLVAGLQKPGTGDNLMQYLGTFIEAGPSSARYTVAMGMLRPVEKREDVQTAWDTALSALAPADAFTADVRAFLKLILGRATSREHYLLLAHNVGQLDQATGGVPAMLRFLL